MADNLFSSQPCLPAKTAGSDPAALSREQKLALLLRLHMQLQSAHAQLVKATQVTLGSANALAAFLWPHLSM